jgi:DNA ligase (NAD+)
MVEITAPTHCPDCATAIEAYKEPRSSIVTHWCTNTYCPGRIADMLTFVSGRTILEIDGLGPEMAAKLAKDGYVKTLADLFGFLSDAEQAIEKHGRDPIANQMLKRGFSGAAVVKMVDSMERVRSAGWDRWLAALGIPMIGLRLGKVLAERLGLEADAFATLPAQLRRLETLEIEGIGYHKKAEVLAYANDPGFIEICTSLYGYGIRPKPMNKKTVVEGAPLAAVTFVITGEFMTVGSREYITAQLVRLGATAKSGVTKKVTHLLVGGDIGITTKIKKARELGIQEADEKWLRGIFDQYGVSQIGEAFVVEEVE